MPKHDPPTKADAPKAMQPETEEADNAEDWTASPIVSRSEPDRALEAAYVWLARHAEHRRLTFRWQELEAQLMKEHDWHRLPSEQKAEFPEAYELEALADAMDALDAANGEALSPLAELYATSTPGVLAKLSVATETIWASEDPLLVALLRSIHRDLLALSEAARPAS